MFPADALGDMIRPFLDGDASHSWQVAVHGDAVVGFTFAQEEAFADGAWNLKCIAVDPARQRQGIGSHLLRQAALGLTARGARILLVDTVGSDAFAGQKRFYERHGLRETARIPDFWADGEDKLTFWKRLAPPPAP